MDEKHPQCTAPAPDESDRLDRVLINGVAWTGGSRWLAQLFTWPVTVVVARLLGPEAYGFMAVSTIFTRFLSVIAEAGLGYAIIMSPDVSYSTIRQLNTLAVLLGCLAVAIAVILSPYVAAFFGADEVRTVILALSAVFVIESLAIVPVAVLRRQFRYKELAIAEFARSISDTVITLCLALAGFGYWALVCGYLGGAITSLFMTTFYGRQGYEMPRSAQVRPLVVFGLNFVSQGISSLICSSADIAAAGRLLSTSTTGQYVFALTLASVPLEKITSLVTRVTPGLFFEIRRDPASLKRYLISITRLLALAAFPILFGLAAIAHDFFYIVMGSSWGGAVWPFRLLCAHVAIASVFALLPQILQACGHTGIPTRQAWIAAVVLPLLFIAFGSAWGAVGIAAGWLVGTLATNVPLLMATLRLADTSVREYGLSIWPAASASAAMIVMIQLARAGTASFELWPPFQLMAMIAVGAVTYLLVLIVFHRPLVTQITSYWRRQR
ncbi:lipopolysaccharide biosynthesis protein [Aminobacter anthyllidis]|uniref:Lipopolysaccharide biosynthesis protein n=1 Tax=Aminobacter anthyllidis TaxID=1035067 RepID=A0A9X1AG51_9HYPH|nr:lipopolysaccharide biosynthesis protein [Aminobacter anthyllidis]MBT1159340.1 lipopolysaccharide biosynthesis protein [Aminobacter anthyllidis]